MLYDYVHEFEIYAANHGVCEKKRPKFEYLRNNTLVT